MGSFSTNAYGEGRYYTFTYSTSQDQVKNTTTLNWTLSCAGGVSWYAERTLILTIDGSNVVSKTDRVARYAGNIASGSKTFTHDANGNKSISVKIQAAVETSSITCSGSSTITFPQIKRKSTFGTVSGNTIGGTVTININRNNSSFTHSLWYKVKENGSWVEAVKNVATSGSFTLPMSICSSIPNDNSVYIGLCIQTFNGSTEIGNSYSSITAYVPLSAAPTVSFALSDNKGYSGTYGGYVQNNSELHIATTATANNSATIKTITVKATISGTTYTYYGSSVNISLPTSGTWTISVSATDSRGKSTTAASQSITVLAYSNPTITALSARRTDSSGNATSNGSYLQVIFSATATSLNSKNTTTFQIKYKKKSVSSYTSATLSSYQNKYSVSGGSYIFQAETSSGYNIQLVVTDKFKTVISQTTGNSVSKVFSFFKNGLGIAFGKVAEAEAIAEFDWKIKANKGLIVSGTDINVLINNAVQKLYPVGHILMSTNSANPSTYLGFGTWVAWGSGRVPVGVNSSDTDFSTVEKTGGAKTVNVSHYHTESIGADSGYMYLSAGANGGLFGSGVRSNVGNMSWKGTVNTSAVRLNNTNTAGSTTLNNLQPYVTCYMWKRTA